MKSWPSSKRRLRQSNWYQRIFNNLRNDPYHWLLTISWGKFLLGISLFYLAVNVVFACAYLTAGDGITNAQRGSFVDAFFFSIQTISTVGYGSMHPDTLYAQILVTVEVWVGILLVAVATGLIFARFSRPTARVVFSRVAVVCPFDGVPTLMFRAANRRQNRILEAQVRVSILRNEVSQEGHHLRRFYDLNLLRSGTPAFGLSWLVMHPIDDNSPLFGANTESVSKIDAEIWVTLTGLDETFSQTVHARYAYAAQDILWSKKFVDIFSKDQEGHNYTLDFSRFHDVVPLEDESKFEE